MNPEKRRIYSESLRQMNQDALSREARRIRRGVDLTVYGTIMAVGGVTGLALIAAATNQSSDLRLLIPAMVLTGVAAVAGKFSGDYTYKSVDLNLERFRRGLGVSLSSFQRIGITYREMVSRED